MVDASAAKANETFVFFRPPLQAPDGTIVKGPIRVRLIITESANFLRIGAKIPFAPIIPQGRMDHILSRHSAFLKAPKDDQGIFYPQYSNPAALRQLANEICEGATPQQIGPSKGDGQYAVIAGAMAMKNTETGETIPIFVGTVTPHGTPTNIVAIFITSSNTVWTMYPCGPVIHFHPTSS